MYTKLIEILLALAFAVGAWFYSGHVHVEAYKTAQKLEQAEANDKLQKKFDNLAAEYEVLRTKRKDNAQIITKNVDKIVEKPIYVNSCWELSGLQNANAALRGDSSVTENSVQEAATN